MASSSSQPLWSRLDIHDRKQFEMKLEYQPSPTESKSRYLVETYLFLPASLNIDSDTYPRASFYADIHNYVRLKTPVMSFGLLLSDAHSPLVKMEHRLEAGDLVAEPELIHEAKLLCCIFRAALRRFDSAVKEYAQHTGPADAPHAGEEAFLEGSNDDLVAAGRLLARFRSWSRRLLAASPNLQERTRASLRLVDEYMSLTVEQFFRKTIADMDKLPRSASYVDLRKSLMAKVLQEETYRRENQLRSVLSPTGDNEEYMQRMAKLKKFCMNILFLYARRRRGSQGLEEVLLAVAAGGAMAFATTVAFFAQQRFTQASYNFLAILVIGYMVKDRIKEGLRRLFVSAASRALYDRTTFVENPVTHKEIGECREKVDFGTPNTCPDDIRSLRQVDDFLTVSQGELTETVIHYQKQLVLNGEHLPRVLGQTSGVTDIIRFNVDHLLRDMDEPEYPIEYVDVEDLSIGRIKGAKSYQVDMAFRFTVDDDHDKKVSTQLVRLILDRNGIKRMVQFQGGRPAGGSGSVRSVA